MGWHLAKAEGVKVGENRPLENSQIPHRIADIVYTLFPYPETGYSFGRAAANIAKLSSGTQVLITSLTQLRYFDRGFTANYPWSVYRIEYSGTAFGLKPAANWEGGAMTYHYSVP
ncbi:MAG: hypothetical protein L0346_09545 [Chloroflexi bacterium]|nr:hypothetical protein [Chloroflexota bacterium]